VGRSFFEQFPVSKLIPDQSVIYGNNPRDTTHQRAAISSDGTWALIYLAQGGTCRAVMGKVLGEKVSVWWFNPAIGKYKYEGIYENKSVIQFSSPLLHQQKDWMLVIQTVQ